MSGAKEREQAEARRLRAEGLSLGAIAHQLGVAKSSVSVWVREVELTDEQRLALRVRGGRTTPAVLRAPRPELGSSGLTRRCGMCERTLPMEAFNRMGDDWQFRCRECFRAYFRARGDLHKQQSAAALAERRAATRAYVIAFLETHPCVDCGIDDLLVLEFDHLADKLRAVAVFVHGGTMERLLDELPKCEVVCVNCHRRRTGVRGGHGRVTGAPPPHWPARRKAAQRAVWDRLERSGCVDCGEQDLAVLDFDHRRDKRASPHYLVRCDATSATILAEMDKCEVRCGNCHRRRTLQERGSYRVAALRSLHASVA